MAKFWIQTIYYLFILKMTKHFLGMRYRSRAYDVTVWLSSRLKGQTPVSTASVSRKLLVDLVGFYWFTTCQRSVVLWAVPSREIRRKEFKKGHVTPNIMVSKWIYGIVMGGIYLYCIPVNSVCAHACKDSSLVYLWYFQSGQQYHGLLLMLTTSIYWHKVDHLHNMLTTSVW